MVKRKRENDKKQSEIPAKPKKSWEEISREAVINDEEWNCHVIFLAVNDIRFKDYLTSFHEAAKTGKRRSVKTISFEEEMRNLTIQNIRSHAKQRCQEHKIKLGFATFFDEAQNAILNALQETQCKPHMISGSILAHFIKLLILMIKDTDLELYAKETELKHKKDMEVIKMTSIVEDNVTKTKKSAKTLKDDAKSQGSKNIKKENMKAEKKQQKLHGNITDSNLCKRGEEWQNMEYIKDQPVNGPKMYIALVGFLHKDLPLCLREIGVPLTAIIKVTDQEETNNHIFRPAMLKSPIVLSKHSVNDSKGVSSRQMLSVSRSSINKTLTETKSVCDWIDPEETKIETSDKVCNAVITGNENSNIEQFWEGLKLLEEEDPLCLKDIALLAYHSPDFPNNLQSASKGQKYKDAERDNREQENKRHLKLEKLAEKDPEKQLIQRKPNENKTEERKYPNAPENTTFHASNWKDSVYDLVSNILYCVENIHNWHQNYLSHMKTISLNCTSLLQDVTMDESLQLYNEMVSQIPLECTTVPFILHCLLEQVDALCKRPSESKMYVSELSEEKQKYDDYIPQPERSVSQELETKLVNSSVSTNTLSFKTSSHSERISLGKLSEIQEIKEKTAFYILEPQEIKSQSVEDKSRSMEDINYHKVSSKNECTLTEPRVILHGDLIDLLTFHLEVPTIDVQLITLKMLQQNSLVMLWENYPPLQPMQYIKHNCVLNRLCSSMGSSTKLTRKMLEHFLHLTIFEELCTTQSQESTYSSSETFAKYSSEFGSSIFSPCDSKYMSAAEDRKQSHKVNTTIQEEDTWFSEHKLKFPYLCAICITPLRAKGRCDMTYDNIKSSRNILSEMDSVHKKNYINLIEKAKKSRKSSDALSDLLNMLECPELMQQLDSEGLIYSNHLGEHDYPCLASDYHTVEKLNKPVMLQTLQKYMETFRNIKHKFSPLTDALLLYFHHGDNSGMQKDKWCASIESPVAFRDFYDYVFNEKTDEYVQRSAANDQQDYWDYCEKEVKSDLQPHFRDEDFFLENSIKYKINIQKRIAEEQHLLQESKFEKMQKTTKTAKAKKNVKDMASDEKHKKKHKESNNNKQDQSNRTTSLDKDSEKKQAEIIIKTSETDKEFSFQDTSSKQTSVNESFEFESYDLGPLRVQYSGAITHYVSSNRCHTRVEISQWLYDSTKIYSEFCKHGHTLSLYTNCKPSIGPFVEEPFMFHLVTTKDVILVFTKCCYKPSSKNVSTNLKLSDKQMQEGATYESSTAKITRNKANKMSKTANDKKSINTNIGNNIKRKSSRLYKKKKHINTMENVSLKITWPNGLLIETVATASEYEEQNENFFTTVFPRCDHLYIRQRYLSKGPECSAVHEEEYRCVLHNGSVLKFMANATVQVLTANGIIFYMNEILKPETSKSQFTVNGRSSKSVKKDSMKENNKEERKTEAELKKPKNNKDKNSEHTIFLAESTTSRPEISLWEIKEYEMLLSDGVLLNINKDTGTQNIIQRMLCHTSTDYRTGEVITLRGDGTSILLLPGGNIITKYPDNTTICIVVHESIVEWTSEEIQELLSVEMKIREEMNQTIENKSRTSVSSHEIFEQGAYPTQEGFVLVNTTILVEHPNYATVIYEGLKEDVIIKNPHGLEVAIKPNGTHNVKLDSTTSLNVKPNTIQFEAFDNNQNVTSYTEINLDVPNKGEICSSILSKTIDIHGNILLVHWNGETETLQANDLAKESSCDVELPENTYLHGRCVAVYRDLTGFEMLHDKDISAHLETSREMANACTCKDSIIGSTNLYNYTTITPVYNTTSQEWLMPSSELISKLKERDLIPSTYGPYYSWIHPFNLPKLKSEENFGAKQPGKQMKQQLALKLRILQEILPKGTNIAESLHHYWSMAQDLCSNLSYEYTMNEEEEDMQKTLDSDVMITPQNVIKMYHMTLAAKNTLEQILEHLHQTQREHLDAWFAKMKEEAEELQFLKELIQTKCVPPYFDTVPGECFGMLKKTTDKALTQVKEDEQEDIPEFCKQLIPLRKVLPSTDKKEKECFEPTVETAGRTIMKVKEDAKEDLAEFCRQLIPLPKVKEDAEEDLAEFCRQLIPLSKVKEVAEEEVAELCRQLIPLSKVEEVAEKDLSEFCRQLISLYEILPPTEKMHSECFEKTMETVNKTLMKVKNKYSSTTLPWKIVLSTVSEETTLDHTMETIAKTTNENAPNPY